MVLTTLIAVVWLTFQASNGTPFAMVPLPMPASAQLVVPFFVPFPLLLMHLCMESLLLFRRAVAKHCPCLRVLTLTVSIFSFRHGLAYNFPAQQFNDAFNASTGEPCTPRTGTAG
jgi:hypothetical protein